MENKPTEQETNLPPPSDTEILLDEEAVGKYTIRPWRIAQCMKLVPVFEQIVQEAKQRKITLRDLYMTQPGQKAELINFDQVVFIIMPHVPKIFSVTLDMPEKDVGELDQQTMFAILTTILRQNLPYLKNWFALIMALARQVIVP